MAAVLVSAGLAGAFLGEPLAHAQGDDNDYVDVGLILEVPAEAITGANLRRKLNIIVVNHGSRTAYDVEVVVKIEYPEDSSYFLAPSDYHIIADLLEIPVGSVSQGEDRYSLRWSIPTLEGGVRETLGALVMHKALTRDAPETFDNASYVHGHYGEVTTSSFESDLHKGNNTHRVWSYRTSPTGSIFYQVGGNYSVAVLVDDPAPSPGDTVTFTIKTDRADPYPDVTGASIPPIDLKVDIELADGLSVTGSPTYRPSNKADSVEYSNGVFNIGTLKAGEPIENEVDLPITVAANAAGNRQCLTATLTGSPPPGSGPYDDQISDNVAELCLGPAPAGEQVVLDDGDVDLFTWYDCVGKTTAPCNDSDSLALVVAGDAAPEFGTVFQPSQVIIHIPDEGGRSISSASDSTALVWSTGVDNFTGLPGGEDRPGAVVAVNNKPLNYKPTDAEGESAANWGVDHPQYSNWHTGHIKVTAVVPTDDQDNPLGEIKGWRKKNPPDELFWGNDVDPNDSTNPTILIDYNMYLGDSDEAVGGWRDERYIEFSALGTYSLTVTTTVEYDDDGDDNTGTTSYSDTETYAFHVGPILDLSVVAGGASQGLTSSQTAYTIRAANNGPENSVDATVNVALPAGAQVMDPDPAHIEGTYVNGVWTLPGLKTRDYRRSEGIPEEATLTLILQDGGGVPAEPATATISLTDNSYNVCIASDRSTLAHDNETDCEADAATNVWYTAVCVQDSDQTVTTHDQSTCGTTSGHTWTANVCASSEGKVIAGQAETGCDGWHTGTVYDYNAANNTAEITALAGSASTAALPGAPSPRAAKSGAPSVTVQWEPVATVNSVAVTHYQVERSASDWETIADNVEETTWIDTTVQPGKTYRYRVRAVNGAGVAGPPSVPINASIAAGEVRTITETQFETVYETDEVIVEVEVEVEVEVPLLPAGPTELTAVAEGEEAIALSWSGPDRLYDHPVRGYEVEASEDGERWTTLETRVDGASYTHRGLEAGSTRYYRVYAHNSEGRSLASEAVQATTEGVPPGPQSAAELFRPLIYYGLLTAVFHYDNETQEWTFFDPAPEFAELNTLAPIDLSADHPVILIVHVRSMRVEFLGQTLYPGWNYITVR